MSGRFSVNRSSRRQVLDCASPLALSDRVRGRKSGRGLPQSKTLARRGPTRRSSWSDCVVEKPSMLSKNPPTPDPSQEGSRYSSASCPFPSWDGLGVGSWSQCMCKSERRLSLKATLSFGMKLAAFAGFIVMAAIPAARRDAGAAGVTAERKPNPGPFYVTNRAPLAPGPFLKLPIGSIRPRGWLRRQLELEAGGMTGRLPEISKCQQRLGLAGRPGAVRLGGIALLAQGLRRSRLRP